MHARSVVRRVPGGRGHRRAAFTLVELIVVLAIIGTLVGMLLPAVQRARESARQASCRNNLRNIGVAILNYESARRAYPIGCDNLTGTMHAWSSFILPYLEEGVTAARIDYAKPWDDVPATGAPGNLAAADSVLPIYVCPSGIVRYRGKQDYFGLAGIGRGAEGVPAPDYDPGPARVLVPEGDWDTCGMLYHTASWAPRGVEAASVTDGLSHTLMVSESTDAADASELSGPDPADVDHYLRTVVARWAKGSSQLLNKRVVNDNRGEAFFSNHFGALFALFADGRVAAINEGISPTTLVAVSTRNGGEIQSEY
jgi:prepilin-type N-terminal cleavage/methylation domain-containing protein